MNILIMGASRGIGLEFVRQYAHAGARVIATARSEEGLGKIKASVTAMRQTISQVKACNANVFWHHDGRKYSGF